LLIVIALLLATYAVAAVVIVSTQRSLLIDQVDARLTGLPPASFVTLTDPPPGASDSEVMPAPNQGEDTNSAFTDLYVGVAKPDGSVTSLLVGGPVMGVPDVLEAVNATGGRPGLVTVQSTDGNSRFRAFVIHQSGTSDVVVAASSLDEVDDSLNGLERTLWIAGGVTAGVLGIAFFWIQHLGLRPIARVTSIAEAIASGDRSQRVPMTDGRTEAGKLGLAFNVMLDERDAGERRLRQFVADASHELRTPLTSVRGYLELFRQGAFRKPEQLDDVVRRLSAEATRMHELVDDLLVLASLDEGRPLRIDEVDVGQLVRDAAQDAQATQPNRHFEVEVPEETPTVQGDEALLVQLVGILVANALTHTPATALVSLSVIPGDTEVAVVVEDGGPGLEAELAERVFDRFWRGELSRTRSASNSRSGSTGLGLAIARSITDSHGGSIMLDTAPGEGCTFTIRIPRHPELTDYS
jgi:two-component system OmpR family sensor kinase